MITNAPLTQHRKPPKSFPKIKNASCNYGVCWPGREHNSLGGLSAAESLPLCRHVEEVAQAEATPDNLSFESAGR